MQAITSFQGQHRWLSNFWPAFVTLDGVRYPSVENAYQAAKTAPENRSLFVNATPGGAKRLGRRCPVRPDWDDRKLAVMEDLIRQKFRPGYRLAALLLQTKDAHIEEGNTWGDQFWGVCEGVGTNNLGLILMRVRHDLAVCSEV